MLVTLVELMGMGAEVEGKGVCLTKMERYIWNVCVKVGVVGVVGRVSQKVSDVYYDNGNKVKPNEGKQNKVKIMYGAAIQRKILYIGIYLY